MLYSEYLQSKHWKQKRSERLKLDGFKCQRCPSKRLLQVHHLSYKNLWREPLSDLLTLCRDCHEKEHFPGIPAVIRKPGKVPRRMIKTKGRKFRQRRSRPPVQPVKTYYRNSRLDQ